LTDEDVGLIAACCERYWPRFHRLFGGDCAAFDGDRRLATMALAACLWEAGVRDRATIDRIVGASGLMSEVPVKIWRDESAEITMTSKLQGAPDERAPVTLSHGNG
jgi:hypothetical protein